MSPTEEYQITGVIHDEYGIVVKVYIDGNAFTVSEIYDWVETGKYTFYTLKKGKKAYVHIGLRPAGRKYITTHPDRRTENNLSELKPLKITTLFSP